MLNKINSFIESKKEMLNFILTIITLFIVILIGVELIKKSYEQQFYIDMRECQTQYNYSHCFENYANIDICKMQYTYDYCITHQKNYTVIKNLSN